MTTLDDNSFIRQIYEDFNYPSLERLFKLAKTENKNITRQQVKTFLDKQEEQQVFKNKQKKKRLGVITANFEKLKSKADTNKVLNKLCHFLIPPNYLLNGKKHKTILL